LFDNHFDSNRNKYDGEYTKEQDDIVDRLAEHTDKKVDSTRVIRKAETKHKRFRRIDVKDTANQCPDSPHQNNAIKTVNTALRKLSSDDDPHESDCNQNA
jgi:hypothetical protein